MRSSKLYVPLAHILVFISNIILLPGDPARSAITNVLVPPRLERPIRFSATRSYESDMTSSVKKMRYREVALVSTL